MNGACLSLEEAIRVAEEHYDAVVSGDYEAWLNTLTSDLRRQASIRGGTPDFWWRAGRAIVEKKGARYVFERVDRVEEGYVKLFFRRVRNDGSQLGMPVPIHLRLEEGEWKVEQASY